jgi:hypothetical protein
MTRTIFKYWFVAVDVHPMVEVIPEGEGRMTVDFVCTINGDARDNKDINKERNPLHIRQS